MKQAKTVERSTKLETVELIIGERPLATTDDSEQLVLALVEVTDISVTLDANHPLAGKDLTL